MESWQTVFCKGIAPCLTIRQLEALRAGLLDDDPRLIQGATTSPPPLQGVADWPVEGACALSYCGWQEEPGLRDTVAKVEEFFARLCFEVDQRLGEPAAIRWFLNWFDECDRTSMRQQLLLEVQQALELRRAAAREQNASPYFSEAV